MPKPRTIALGQTVELPFGVFTLVSYRGGIANLRNDLTGDYVVMDHLELSRLLPPSKPLREVLESEPKTFVEVMEALSDDERALLPHIQELVDGTPPGGGTPRPEYDLGKPLVWRCNFKESELSQLGIELPASSIKRKVLQYRKAGPSALIDQRRTRTEAAFKRVDERIPKELAKLIAGYAGQSSPTYTKLAAELRELLMLNYEAHDRPKPPSVRSVERYVKMLGGDQDPTIPGKRRETQALAGTQHHQARLVSAPGDECQIDSTELDAFVRFPNGEVKRPWLTMLLDKRTNSIVGFTLTDGQPNGLDHVRLLADALVPRPLRSWSRYYKEHNLPVMPWSMYLTQDEAAKYDAHRPYIYPRRILIDNGSDFRGEVFRAACNAFGISLTQSPIKAPTAKAKVERHFGVINDLFTQYLPGYTGSNVRERGEKAQKADVLPIATVADLFERWVAVVWQNRQHSGLVDPYDPSLRHTPNTMYAASVDIVGHFVVPFEDMDFISLMPFELRTVQSDGIELNSRQYDSIHLAPMRGQTARTGETVRIKVHYDPVDFNQVWVRANTGEWITCTWTQGRGRTRPLEETLQRNLHAHAPEGGGFRNDQAADMVLALRNDIMQEASATVPAKPKTATTRRAQKEANVALAAVLAASARDTPSTLEFEELDTV